MISESFIIDKYLRPLSKNFKDSLNLSDDAAVLKNLKNKNFIISVDNFIYGVHCPKFINISHAVKRAILVAISDLSAMAAKPYCIFLSITLNKSLNVQLLEDLSLGIKKALYLTKTELAGGDLCSSKGPISFSVTAVGESKKIKTLRRKGAKPGELLCVTGNIGDAKIGLDNLIRNKVKINSQLNDYFVRKFLIPPFRSKFTIDASKYISSCIDISDGLIEDASKLAKNSNCGLEFFLKDIPFSIKAKKLIKNTSLSARDLLNAGDDYELAFSINHDKIKNLKDIGKKNNVKISVIGKFKKESVVNIHSNTFFKGYSHF